MHPSYEQLLEQAKHDPASVDFSDLRMAYTETPAYSPHSRNDALDLQLNDAIAQQNWPLVLQTCQQRIEKNELDIKAHLWAKTAYEQLEQHDRAWSHYNFANALLDSIKASGDGLSAATAYVLIDSSEKWAFLDSQGYQFISEQRHPDSQHIVEIVDARDAQQRSVRLFFNLDITDEKTSAAIDGPRKLSDFGIHPDDEAFAPPQEPTASASSTASAPSNVFASDEDEEQEPTRRRRRRRRDDDQNEDERPDNKPSLDLDEVLKNLGVKLGPNKNIYTHLTNLSSKAQSELVQLHKNKDRMKVAKGAGWFLATCGLFSGLGIFAFWFFLMAEGEFRNNFAIMTSLFAFFGAMCLVWGAARLWGLLRSRIGSFFFPHSFYLIRTDFDRVEAWPYVFLYPDACSLTHHTTDGNYSYSDLQLHFLGYGNVAITFHDMHLAEDFLGQVFQQRADTFAELAESDFKRAQGADLMHIQGPVDAAPVKRWWFRPAIWVGITLLTIAVGSPVNAYFIEEKDWDYAASSARRSSFEYYLRLHPYGRYANDARLAIDNAVFEEARKSYTAVAFRKYLNEFPQGHNVKAAREMLQDLYEKALTNYQKQIGTPNRSTGLMLKILQDLKKHDTYTVFVRFSPNLLLKDNKDADAQKALGHALKINVPPQDAAILRNLGTYFPAPIKPAFRSEENFSREQYIVQQLEQAFRAIIPQGIMDFVRVEQAPSNARVVLNIKYDIRQKYTNRERLTALHQSLRYSRSPIAAALRDALNDPTLQQVPVIYTQTRTRSYGYGSGANYGRTTKTPVRTLFGVEIDWGMEIQLAGQPSEQFTFASDAAASIRLGGQTHDPVDVYRQIAQSAFQRFSQVLQRQFGVYDIPRYNPSTYNRYGTNNPYGGLGTYRAQPSVNPYLPRPYIPRPYIPPISPLSFGAGTPTGTPFFDDFVNGMPPIIRAEYMAKPHHQRRMDLMSLWVRLDRIYIRLPFRIKQKYRRYTIQQRRLRMLHLLERNKSRTPSRNTRPRPKQDDPFGP